MAWSDPKTWTADDLLTASDLNQYVSDNLSALYALVQGGGRKNLLHNGAMQVHQRGTSSTLLGTSAPTTADRWAVYGDVAGATASLSVESDAPTGSGFRKSLKWLQTNSGTVGTSGQQLVAQRMEGQNLQSIKKGTASAEQLTLSFWTKSNKTGTYVVELQDADNTRSVSATYTVAASATWEQHAITFPADATGAFDNDSASSLSLNFYLAAGTNFTSGTLATTWGATTAANCAVGQTNLAADTSNYWQITGVQLETGSAATGFEFKGYEQELSECQRYCYVFPGPGGGSAASAFAVYAGLYSDANTIYYAPWGVNPTAMRVTTGNTGLTVAGIGTQGTHFGVMAGGATQTGWTFSCDTYTAGIILASKTGHATTPYNSALTGAWILSADL